METKSRYEVISDLEEKKRDLIRERDGLNDGLIAKEEALIKHNRTKEDTMVQIKRIEEDLNTDLDNFKSSMDERKETIIELIKGVEDSLDRFNNLNKEKKS